MKLDAFAQHDLKSLKARGLPVVHELLDAIKARADRGGQELSEVCGKLSKPWQATMLLANILDSFERDQYIPEIIREFAEMDDRMLMIAALKEIREPTLAKLFGSAEDVVDEDPSKWKAYGPPEPQDLVRLHKKIFALVSAMDEPFPAAD